MKHWMSIAKWVVSAGLMSILISCASGDIPLVRIDTPVHHVKIGERMLEMRKLEAAYREFERALDLDPKYAPAFIGISLVHGMRSEYPPGVHALDQADRLARGKAQEMAVHVGRMRFLLAGGEHFDPHWLARVEKTFSQAVILDNKDPAPHYYLGLAYKEARQYDRAAKHFYRVMEMGGAFSAAASEEYRLAEEMGRATPTR
jgi:tetratricopeptide (TPR) repeat protein